MPGAAPGAHGNAHPVRNTARSGGQHRTGGRAQAHPVGVRGRAEVAAVAVEGGLRRRSLRFFE